MVRNGGSKRRVGLDALQRFQHRAQRGRAARAEHAIRYRHFIQRELLFEGAVQISQQVVQQAEILVLQPDDQDVLPVFLIAKIRPGNEKSPQGSAWPAESYRLPLPRRLPLPFPCSTGKPG